MESNFETEQTKSVLIVGAGRSGMLTARHLSTIKNCSITIVEAKSEIGGIWSYDELTEHHPQAEDAKRTDNYYKLYNCFQGSIYPHVISNTYKEFLSYKDFTIDDYNPKLPGFPNMKEYHGYLNAYWEHFNIKKLMTFNTLVKSIRPYENLPEEQRTSLKDLPQRSFVVTTIDAKAEGFSQNEKVATYDYVVVCCGMHSKPYIPQLNGIANFKGLVMHSKDFREPDEKAYQDKTILLLGGSYSGIDMVIQFFHNPVKGKQQVKKLIFCGSETAMVDKSTDFKNLREEGAVVAKKGWVSDFTEDSVVFTDGSTEKVDVVMYCTGYKVNFNFLDPTDKILEFGGEESRGKYFGPLYKRMISIRQPKLFFAGYVDFTALINYISEVQSMVIKHLIDGSVKLPSTEEMTKELEQDIAEEKAGSKDGSLTNFFKLSVLKTDLAYVENLKKTLQHLYPGTEEKATKNFARKVAIFKKSVEFFMNGDLLSFKNYDFGTAFPEEIKGTSEFI